jgi:hypothetical protein
MNHEKICSDKQRLPIELRINKLKGLKFLQEVKTKNIEIKNPNIFVLASWLGSDIGNYKHTESYSEVKSISEYELAPTYDMHIKTGNSYTANGIFCHNTINLPNDVTEEKVAEIYETAWKLKCKGITVYRSGCRDGVLISSEPKEKKEVFPKTTALKRPEILDCDIHNVICGGKKFFVIVSFLHESPYEVFAGYHYISGKPEIGTVVKRKRGHYTLFDEEGEVLIENLDDYCEDDQEAILRLVSTSLRHGADISFIVHQLEKVKGTLQSFAKCLARQLKKYIPDGTEISGESCNECNGKIIRSGGCLQCQDCGWSKC